MRSCNFFYDEDNPQGILKPDKTNMFHRKSLRYFSVDYLEKGKPGLLKSRSWFENHDPKEQPITYTGPWKVDMGCI